MKPVGFMIPKDHHLVFVCINEETGEKVAVHRGNYGIDRSFTVVGVYLCDSAKYQERQRRGRPPIVFKSKAQGVPEGFELKPEMILDRKTGRWNSTGNWVLQSWGRSSSRENYRLKLKKIQEKAQDLIAVGFNRKAALMAARKCSCQAH